MKQDLTVIAIGFGTVIAFAMFGFMVALAVPQI